MKYKELSEKELVTIVRQKKNTDRLFADAGADALDLSVVSFCTIADALEFCQMFEGGTLSGSRMYKYMGKYHLIVALDGMPGVYVRQFCLLTNEFANGYAYGDVSASVVIEHGNLVCDDVCYLMRKAFNTKHNLNDAIC